MGGSNAQKWGDHERKKFFINNSVEGLIPSKEKHQGPFLKMVRLQKMELSSLKQKNNM